MLFCFFIASSLYCVLSDLLRGVLRVSLSLFPFFRVIDLLSITLASSQKENLCLAVSTTLRLNRQKLDCDHIIITETESPFVGGDWPDAE